MHFLSLGNDDSVFSLIYAARPWRLGMERVKLILRHMEITYSCLCKEE